MSKKKKEKITYVDDGRTIADMSGVRGGMRLPKPPSYKPPASFKEIWKTYWSAVKMMFTPMLVVIVGLLVIYMVVYAIFLFL